VGSSLDALMYGFINNYPVFFTAAHKPFRFDYFQSNLDLSPFQLRGQSKTLTTFGAEMTIGIPKKLLWERLVFLMSLKGNIPLSNLCHSIRYDGDRIICSNDYSKIMEFTFNNCYYFGDDRSVGFVEKRNLDEENYLCYDYIAFNSGGKHEVDFIHTGDDFVSEIWFYSSDRIDGNTPVRDACAVSKLTKKQLLDFDYSQTMARFKTLQHMKNNGMRGKFNGYTKKGTPRHYDFRTSSIRRETSRVESEYEPTTGDIHIQKTCEKDLLQSLSDAIKPYDRILGMLNEDSSKWNNTDSKL
jgi:hypothetical protein